MFHTSKSSSIIRRDGMDIYLHLLQPQHVQALFQFRTNNRAFLQPFSPVQLDEQFTCEAQQRAIQTAEQEASTDLAYRFGIFHQSSDQLIGQLNLTGIIRGAFHNALLGYSMDQRYNGRGYTTEAVKLGIDLAFGELQLHRIQAAVMPHNHGSVRVLQKNGFTEEGYARKYLQINGVWEDHLLFARINEDW
jgi:[ribosomal protein S5]-alanine N-acetyltransferase